MNGLKMKAMQISAIFLTAITAFICMSGDMVVYANNTDILIPANVYDLDEDSHYLIGETSPSESKAIGTLFLDGAVKTSDEVSSFSAYEISNGNVMFTYKILPEVLKQQKIFNFRTVAITE